MAVQRSDLIPAPHRPERTFLLDLLGPDAVDVDAASSIDAAAFFEITPKTLHPYIHWRLQQAGDRAPARLRSLFAEAYRENAFRHLRRVADLSRIDAALRSANIPYLLLKGPVLAASVYPDPATRTMLDVDLLMREAEVPRAMSALAEIGYTVPLQFAGLTIQAGDAPPLFNGQPGSPVVELHAMLDSAPDDPRAVEAVWSTARVVDLGHGLNVQTLGRAEFFAHVVTHVSRHHRFEGELRSLLDVALLLRSSETDLDWSSLNREWNQRGIDGWIELTIVLANVMLGVPIPKELADRAPAAEALALAAEQLWVDKDQRISGKITYLFAGTEPAPVHANVAPQPVPMPTGLAGMRLRAVRQWQRVHRIFTTLRDGTLRPRNIGRNVHLFRNRERLFTLVESGANRTARRS
jgi:hypothetical protein